VEAPLEFPAQAGKTSILFTACRFVRGQSDDANRWCRGPESNWLRPPFQGGALPMSYPGIIDFFNFRDHVRCCQFCLRQRSPQCASSRRRTARPKHKGRASCVPLCRHRTKWNAKEANGGNISRQPHHSCDSSNSFIQLRFLRTSRGFVPSGGPTMPSFSIKSISRAARP
jgi:hypothetical protein